MSRNLTASDRKSLIKLASSLEKGSPERRAILAGLEAVGHSAGTAQSRLGAGRPRPQRRARYRVTYDSGEGRSPYEGFRKVERYFRRFQDAEAFLAREQKRLRGLLRNGKIEKVRKARERRAMLKEARLDPEAEAHLERVTGRNYSKLVKILSEMVKRDGRFEGLFYRMLDEMFPGWSYD